MLDWALDLQSLDRLGQARPAAGRSRLRGRFGHAEGPQGGGPTGGLGGRSQVEDVSANRLAKAENGATDRRTANLGTRVLSRSGGTVTELARLTAGPMQVRDVEGGEPACRPGSVPSLARGGGHPSRAAVADGLVQSTREHRAGSPRTLAQLGAVAGVRPLDLAPGGVYQQSQSPATLVVSYTTVSPLPSSQS